MGTQSTNFGWRVWLCRHGDSGSAQGSLHCRSPLMRGCHCSDNQRCGLWEMSWSAEVQTSLQDLCLDSPAPFAPVKWWWSSCHLFCHSGAVLLTYLRAQMPRLAQYTFLSQASGLGPGKLSFQYTSSADSLGFVKHSSRANRAEAILWLPNGC